MAIMAITPEQQKELMKPTPRKKIVTRRTKYTQVMAHVRETQKKVRIAAAQKKRRKIIKKALQEKFKKKIRKAKIKRAIRGIGRTAKELKTGYVRYKPEIKRAAKRGLLYTRGAAKAYERFVMGPPRKKKGKGKR